MSNQLRHAILLSFMAVPAVTACDESRAPTRPACPLAPTSMPGLDPLGVLPSKPGELQIRNAWRPSAGAVDTVIGEYEWEGRGVR